MLTIHHLSVDFEVGGDDTAVFARLFAEHIREWSQRQDDVRARSRLLAREASLTGDGPARESSGGPAAGCFGGS
ncbi:putative phage tail protein [Streptomyces sp. NPDC097610]|uniref:putative phage tail protein n=1 Tax=Streptomyces sp. NPDC097610 TaxID=3157227 RepID=UPI0033323541